MILCGDFAVFGSLPIKNSNNKLGLSLFTSIVISIIPGTYRVQYFS